MRDGWFEGRLRGKAPICKVERSEVCFHRRKFPPNDTPTLHLSWIMRAGGFALTPLSVSPCTSWMCWWFEPQTARNNTEHVTVRSHTTDDTRQDHGQRCDTYGIMLMALARSNSIFYCSHVHMRHHMYTCDISMTIDESRTKGKAKGMARSSPAIPGSRGLIRGSIS